MRGQTGLTLIVSARHRAISHESRLTTKLSRGRHRELSLQALADVPYEPYARFSPFTQPSASVGLDPHRELDSHAIRSIPKDCPYPQIMWGQTELTPRVRTLLAKFTSPQRMERWKAAPTFLIDSFI